MARIHGKILLPFLAACACCLPFAFGIVLKATGSQSGKLTPTHVSLGVGHAHRDSNAFKFYDYLGPNAYRVYVNPADRWIDVVKSTESIYGDQFGVSFKGTVVDSQRAFNNAVKQLRDWVKISQNSFEEWLMTNPQVNWTLVYGRIRTTMDNSVNLRALGSGEAGVEFTAGKGVPTVVVWNVKCGNLPFNTTDPANPEFWKQAWEMYRLFYFGGQYLAPYGVKYVELNNEPGIGNNYCYSGSVEELKIDMRIRSQAMQESYMDYNKKFSTNIDPVIMVPPASSPARNAFMEVVVSEPSLTFSRGVVPGWKNYDVYSYHQYNVPTGQSMLNGLNYVKGNISQLGAPPGTDVYMTETNCYSSSGAEADQFRGIDIMDVPNTAACAFSRLAWMYGEADWLNFFKFSQTINQDHDSGVTKNGVVWASNDVWPYNVGGTSKTAEAVRLLWRKSPGKKPMWGFTSDATPDARYRYFMVDDLQAYYFYSSNEQSISQPIDLDVSTLPGVVPSSYFIVSAVNASHHAEVTNILRLSTTSTISISQNAGSVLMMTLPKVPVTKNELITTEDATVFAGSNSNINYGATNVLTVSTSATNVHDTTAVSLLKFDTSTLIGGVAKTVYAGLRIRINATTAPTASYQVLTVFGIPSSSWSGPTVTWNSLPAVLPLDNTVTIDGIHKNFINWNADGLVIVGHLTIPGGSSSSGKLVQLDVTDYIKKGVTSFMVARLYRFEERIGPSLDIGAKLPGDVLIGSHAFRSMEDANIAYRPRLFVLQQN